MKKTFAKFMVLEEIIRNTLMCPFSYADSSEANQKLSNPATIEQRQKIKEEENYNFMDREARNHYYELSRSKTSNKPPSELDEKTLKTAFESLRTESEFGKRIWEVYNSDEYGKILVERNFGLLWEDKTKDEAFYLSLFGGYINYREYINLSREVIENYDLPAGIERELTDAFAIGITSMFNPYLVALERKIDRVKESLLDSLLYEVIRRAESGCQFRDDVEIFHANFLARYYSLSLIKNNSSEKAIKDWLKSYERSDDWIEKRLIFLEVFEEKGFENEVRKYQNKEIKSTEEKVSFEKDEMKIIMEIGKEEFSEARDYEKKGDLESAISSYEDSIKKHPGSSLAVTAHYLMAKNYERMGKARQAIKEYCRVLYYGNDFTPADILYERAVWSIAQTRIKQSEEDALINVPITYRGFFNPVYSPDGTRIIFPGKRKRWITPDPLEILIADSDGTNVRRLVANSWNFNQFWIDNEWVGFSQQHREGNSFQQTFYKVSSSGGEISELETKYPKEGTGFRVGISYYSDKLEIARSYKYIDDKLSVKVYVNGKLNKEISDWEDFVILPGGNKVAYQKEKGVYIRTIKPVDEVGQIVPIGEPVVVEGCSLLGGVEKGEYEGNITVQKYGNNEIAMYEIVMLDQHGKEVSSLVKTEEDVGYGSYKYGIGFDLGPHGKSLVHTPYGGGAVYLRRIDGK